MKHDQREKNWFPASRSDCGWEFTSVWQGWAVLIGYVILLFTGISVINEEVNAAGFLIDTVMLPAVFIIIWRTGEPLLLRWGK